MAESLEQKTQRYLRGDPIKVEKLRAPPGTPPTWGPAVIVRASYNDRYGSRDLMGWMDLIAVWEPRRFVGIQVSDRTHGSHRRKKMLANPLAKAWVKAGGEAWLVTWKRLSPRKWDLKVEVLSAEMFA